MNRDEHPRPLGDAGIDIVVRSDVAYGRESGLERPLRVEGRVVRLLGRKAHDSLKEIAEPVVRRLPRQVDVRVDEPRQQRRVAQVDQAGSGRHR